MQQIISSQMVSRQTQNERCPLVAFVGHNPTKSALGPAIGATGMEVITLRPEQISEALDNLRSCVAVVLDVRHPPREWMLLCSRLKRQGALSNLAVIAATTSYDRRDVRAWIEVGAADYINTLYGYEDLLARLWALAANRERALDGARQLLADLDTTMVRTVAAHDPATAGHMRRVATLALDLGRQMGLRPTELGVLARGALFHDVGKLAVSPALLRKPGPLNDAERMVLRRHPDVGASIVAGLPGAAAFLPIVRGHHERPDGRGYPDGLSGTRIPLGARIVAVADAFDALTAPRPYRQILTPAAALNHLSAETGTAWDGHVVDALTQTLDLSSEATRHERSVGATLAA